MVHDSSRYWLATRRRSLPHLTAMVLDLEDQNCPPPLSTWPHTQSPVKANCIAVQQRVFDDVRSQKGVLAGPSKPTWMRHLNSKPRPGVCRKLAQERSVHNSGGIV